MATLPETKSGCCEKSGVFPAGGPLAGVGFVLGPLVPPAPPAGGLTLPCPNIQMLSVSPISQRGKIRLVMSPPVYGYYNAQPVWGRLVTVGNPRGLRRLPIGAQATNLPHTLRLTYYQK